MAFKKMSGSIYLDSQTMRYVVVVQGKDAMLAAPAAVMAGRARIGCASKVASQADGGMCSWHTAGVAAVGSRGDEHLEPFAAAAPIGSGEVLP